nr:uncharacterized protein LOC111509343 isoform X2 [Leptinotarsa decemlineata]
MISTAQLMIYVFILAFVHIRAERILTDPLQWKDGTSTTLHPNFTTTNWTRITTNGDRNTHLYATTPQWNWKIPAMNEFSPIEESSTPETTSYSTIPFLYRTTPRWTNPSPKSRTTQWYSTTPPWNWEGQSSNEVTTSEENSTDETSEEGNEPVTTPYPTKPHWYRTTPIWTKPSLKRRTTQWYPTTPPWNWRRPNGNEITTNGENKITETNEESNEPKTTLYSTKPHWYRTTPIWTNPPLISEATTRWYPTTPFRSWRRPIWYRTTPRWSNSFQTTVRTTPWYPPTPSMIWKKHTWDTKTSNEETTTTSGYQTTSHLYRTTSGIVVPPAVPVGVDSWITFSNDRSTTWFPYAPIRHPTTPRYRPGSYWHWRRLNKNWKTLTTTIVPPHSFWSTGILDNTNPDSARTTRRDRTTPRSFWERPSQNDEFSNNYSTSPWNQRLYDSNWTLPSWNQTSLNANRSIFWSHSNWTKSDWDGTIPHNWYATTPYSFWKTSKSVNRIAERFRTLPNSTYRWNITYAPKVDDITKQPNDKTTKHHEVNIDLDVDVIIIQNNSNFTVNIN